MTKTLKRWYSRDIFLSMSETSSHQGVESGVKPLDVTILQGEIDDGLFEAVRAVENPQFRSLYVRALTDALLREPDRAKQMEWKQIGDIPRESLTRILNRSGAPDGYFRPFAFPALINRATWGAISHMPFEQRAKYVVALRELFKRNPSAVVVNLQDVIGPAEASPPVEELKNPFLSTAEDAPSGERLKVSTELPEEDEAPRAPAVVTREGVGDDNLHSDLRGADLIAALEAEQQRYAKRVWPPGSALKGPPKKSSAKN